MGAWKGMIVCVYFMLMNGDSLCVDTAWQLQGFLLLWDCGVFDIWVFLLCRGWNGWNEA